MTRRDGILILKPEGALVVDVNPFLTQLLGYRREEIVGRPFPEVGFLADPVQAATLLEVIRREGYVQCDDLPLKRRDGSDVLVEIVGNSYQVDDRTLVQLNVSEVTRGGRGEQTPRSAGGRPVPLSEDIHGDVARPGARALLRTITSQARALMEADVGELFLHSPERGLLVRAVGVGSPCSRLGPDLRRGEGLAGKVWEADKSVMLPKEPDDAPCGETRKGLACRRALGTPIRWRGEFLGVLTVAFRRETCFSDSDTKLLELLAGQAALAIVNARLGSELEKLTVVDELTGVLNRRGLATLGTREVERARRLGRPLAMLFVGLDHFKALSDQYSREVGDKALREVGRTIHGSMRKIDVVARYGGEEFVVLLVEAGLGTAVEVAERVRQAVEALSLATDRGPARVTVSVGVTARGPETSDFETLIHRADEAMFVAKKAGRNRVFALAS